MFGGSGLKPRVQLACPVCNVGLTCYTKVVDGNQASWSLTHSSVEHLENAHR